MTYFSRSFLISIFLFLSSCSVIKGEFGHPGGWVEDQLDSRFIDARSQTQRADRYLMSFAMMSVVASDLARTENEAQALSLLIDAGFDDVSKLYHSGEDCIIAPSECSNQGSLNSGAFSFEYHSHELQRTLYSIGRMGVSNTSNKDLVKNIIELDLVGILTNARSYFPILRRFAASYRDSVVILGSAIGEPTFKIRANSEQARVCNNDRNCSQTKKLLKQFQSGNVASLALSEGEESRELKVLINRVDGLSKKRGFDDWTLKKIHRQALLDYINRSCETLKRYAGNDGGESCAIPANPATGTAGSVILNGGAVVNASVTGTDPLGGSDNS